jgi:hypothetical protein
VEEQGWGSKSHADPFAEAGAGAHVMRGAFDAQVDRKFWSGKVDGSGACV